MAEAEADDEPDGTGEAAAGKGDDDDDAAGEEAAGELTADELAADAEEVLDGLMLEFFEGSKLTVAGAVFSPAIHCSAETPATVPFVSGKRSAWNSRLL